MTQILQRFERKHMVWLVNALVFSFFVTVLTFKKGYSYAPMALAGIGIIYLFVHIFKFKKPLNFTKEDKWLIFAFVFYFATFAFSAIYHGDGWREIDNPSRVLLFIPLLFLLNSFSILSKTIFYAVPLGSIMIGVSAVYQKFYLGLERPFPEIISIQAGDISVSLAMFSLVIGAYLLIQRKYTLALFAILGFISGIMSSFLSGARGGWIAIPIVFGTILYLYRQLLNKKMIVGSIIGLVCLVFIATSIPQTGVMKRYKMAEDNVIQYLKGGAKSTSIGSRLDMWQNALEGIKEKPLFGWGAKGYISLKETQIEQNKMYEGNLRFNDAHNQYLDTLVKRGVLGIIGLLLIFLIPLKLFIGKVKNQNLEVRCVAILGVIHILSILFYSLSQTFLAHNSGSIFYFFLNIIFIASLKCMRNN